MQQILIPTDFSKNAWNATTYALQFFKNQNVTFHFLHIDISMQAPGDKELHFAGLASKKEISKSSKTEMNVWLKQVYAYHPNTRHTFKEAIIQASFIDGIRDYNSKKNIEFMVMGTKGASGLKEMTIGSKTGAVITRVKCPILVVPEDARFKKPLTIGFPTDFNMLYKHRIIKTLLDVTKINQSFIKVLRVAQNQKPLDNFQNTNRDLLKLQLNETPHSFHVIENPNLENALQSFVNSMQIDIVAMIAKNLNFFQRILFKPQVARISYHMQIPFLVLHE
ncbi:nucleotide-binding universal stress UspA family protein [Ulvibacter sp. MAR_2010_11]|uniref:universal stress protein n=1 Tax=Ulvibacter sp. MAR_2010_11 TaxID=1250229 RepID=UPI000C2C5B58|nr:universal stress protein [Ulvibacter sp. MAR_2010_11]PKA84493.1 nucleotide-binding universal stress UspA family protein [Ulvibacter sp. MAR_2010_11]